MVSINTLTNCVSVFATVTTIGQFLSGIPSCRKIVRNGTTGELSGLPFVASMFSCAMWTHYGLLKGDTPLILVNSVGLAMQIVYIIVFWRYAVSKTSVNQQIVTSVGSVLIIVASTRLLTDNSEEAVLYQGLICCLATCFFCAAPLATLAHVLRTRNTESLPFIWILMTFLVCSEWLLYGYLIQDVFVQFPNFVGMLLSGIQLSLFLFFPSHGSKIVPTVAIP
ncbi:sugar transporter SWEET1-like [Paramacrobiotus metropolitanus]|uniref:sugar transporter SWEET1-like n=1 Tax=Paramacrobiotus metropolitanus TaxID=2943436 RepID=UPI00244614A6|nr:sugar transporter SWEET1-like [Paramacrobiotus metropolitanus]